MYNMLHKYIYIVCVYLYNIYMYTHTCIMYKQKVILDAINPLNALI